jgi:DNA-binding NarL/FixJ family response regulator
MESSEPKRKIRLLIVEDHPEVRAGIRGLLQAAEDIEIVAEASNGAQAVELANQYAPDFILLDMELPIMRGDAVMRAVLKTQPGVRVLVVSSYNDREYIRDMLAQGARGYLLKEEAPSYLLQAIRSIDTESTGAWLSPQVSQMAALPASFEQRLSWRELAILEQLVDARSEAEIASELNLTREQLAEYLTLLMHKLGATSPEALIEIGRRMLPPGS